MAKSEPQAELERFRRTTAGYIEIVERRLAVLNATPEIEFEEAELQQVLEKLEQLRQSLLPLQAKPIRAIGRSALRGGGRDMTAGAVLPRYVEPDFAREEMYVEPDLDSNDSP